MPTRARQHVQTGPTLPDNQPIHFEGEADCTGGTDRIFAHSPALAPGLRWKELATGRPAWLEKWKMGGRQGLNEGLWFPLNCRHSKACLHSRLHIGTNRAGTGELGFVIVFATERTNELTSYITVLHVYTEYVSAGLFPNPGFHDLNNVEGLKWSRV